MFHLGLTVVLFASLFFPGEGSGLARPLSPEECRAVLPDAVVFEQVEGRPYFVGKNEAGDVLGWLVLSTEVTDIKGYSGAPLVTLVALDTQGRIAGAKILEHKEPILLVGIPEKALLDFVAFYAGKPATAKVVVGRADQADVLQVDAISGATVTALSQNRTILDTALALGVAVGLVAQDQVRPGRFLPRDQVYSWKELEGGAVLGRIRVREQEMGGEGNDPFMDLYYTVADAPQVGLALMAAGDYRWLMDQLQPGEHLLVVLGNGSNSFKGSGFVRGGLFDRIRLEQGLNAQVFRDRDYFNLSHVPAEGAPRFKEGAVFITRAGKLDPGAPFRLVFLGSRYDGKGGFSRSFHEFSSEFRLPPEVYKVEGQSMAIWRQAWGNKSWEIVLLSAILLAVVLLFSFRRWLTSRMVRLKRLHLSVMCLSFAVLGLGLQAQPSVTQVLTFVEGLAGHWRWGLFLSEPLLFISWIFIAVVTLLWGRGVFCGWICPYGALNELVFKLGQWLGVRTYELPESIHAKLRYLRYIILAVLIGVFLISPRVGEMMAEIEPFKSTFFVRPWLREWWFFVWWLVLLGGAALMYRPFCRYLCPLGAALAVGTSIRGSGPYRRQFCTKCKICTKGCEPRAIRDNGTIDPRECLSCMECEANFRDDQVCPPLVVIQKLGSQPLEALSAREKDKLETARNDAIKV